MCVCVYENNASQHNPDLFPTQWLTNEKFIISLCSNAIVKYESLS